MTILEGIQLTTEYLEKKGIDSARMNAELMLAHILKCKRLDLYLQFDKPLKDEEVSLYREFLKRRSQFEPLQYILGTVEFYGLEFKVNRSVLIPRPETEILIETILNNTSKEVSLTILDIGTGSGNIPISLARNLPLAKITSIDISGSAVELANENAVLNGVNENITFVNTGIDEYAPDEKFDIIVSNPPYVSKDEYQNLQPEILNYEPIEAVTDNNDGFYFYNLISEKAKSFLRRPGSLYFELGAELFPEVKNIMERKGFEKITFKKDYLNIDRVIYGELN